MGIEFLAKHWIIFFLSAIATLAYLLMETKNLWRKLQEDQHEAFFISFFSVRRIALQLIFTILTILAVIGAIAAIKAY